MLFLYPLYQRPLKQRYKLHPSTYSSPSRNIWQSQIRLSLWTVTVSVALHACEVPPETGSIQGKKSLLQEKGRGLFLYLPHCLTLGLQSFYVNCWWLIHRLPLTFQHLGWEDKWRPTNHMSIHINVLNQANKLLNEICSFFLLWQIYLHNDKIKMRVKPWFLYNRKLA